LFIFFEDVKTFNNQKVLSQFLVIFWLQCMCTEITIFLLVVENQLHPLGSTTSVFYNTTATLAVMTWFVSTVKHMVYSMDSK